MKIIRHLFGFGAMFIGLVLTISLPLFGIILALIGFGASFGYDLLIKNKQKETISNKVGEPAELVTSAYIHGNKGALGVTENYLAFVQKDNAFKFKLEDITGVVFGSEATGIYMSDDSGTYHIQNDIFHFMIQADGEQFEYKVRFAHNNEKINYKIVKYIKENSSVQTSSINRFQA